ncbi:hypothetical protein KVR01_007544 [Diaporthe batatas]|uniref:uncharacterized protein n=1 Tax=Diaporthe batatas TaxID=748121 RepID=UPI001D03ED63|nr:uncharacterized protein KVR01_007544 [Diaporthe batatas]KAG8163066.1 hypothetical protein KVR01_007544 [Diaporthe batatas]
MQPSHIITTATAMVAHGAAAAFNTTCAWWMLSGQVSLTGYCAGPDTNTLALIRHWAVSSLDLNRCIGVDPTANAMVWQAGGNAFLRPSCSDCAMQSSQVVMQCVCVRAVTGGRTSSSVNLNDRIYTDDYGRLTC